MHNYLAQNNPVKAAGGAALQLSLVFATGPTEPDPLTRTCPRCGGSEYYADGRCCGCRRAAMRRYWATHKPIIKLRRCRREGQTEPDSGKTFSS